MRQNFICLLSIENARGERGRRAVHLHWILFLTMASSAKKKLSPHQHRRQSKQTNESNRSFRLLCDRFEFWQFVTPQLADRSIREFRLYESGNQLFVWNESKNHVEHQEHFNSFCWRCLFLYLWILLLLLNSSSQSIFFSFRYCSCYNLLTFDFVNVFSRYVEKFPFEMITLIA